MNFSGIGILNVFLHYVLKNGKYANNYMDKRPYWGITTIEEQM